MSSSANEQTSVDIFIKSVFTHGRCEESFSKLCNEGCSKEDLSVLLFNVSSGTLAGHGELILDTGGLSKAQLTRLSKDLISVSCLLERVNRTVLNPKNDLLLAPSDPERDPLRQETARLYDMLPGLMLTYSVNLDQFVRFTKANLRRLTVAHYWALRFLRYVQERTGSPQYDDCANLLTAGFLVAGGTEDQIPDFFTTDALAKLNQRNDKLRY